MINKFLSSYDIVLANPYLLWLVFLLPIILYLPYRISKKRKAVFRISSINGIARMPIPFLQKIRPLQTILLSIAFLCFVVILARPQQVNVNENVNSEGIDIVLSIDISGSMMAEDFKPNRLEAAKKTAEEFVRSRNNDRIGLVIFAGESFTQCPITFDKQMVIEQITQIKSGLLKDGTALGMGLATAVDRLRDAQGKSKVIIFMTDGVNSVLGGNTIDPLTALEIAKAFQVKVYTIGVGTIGEALFPVQTPYGNQKVMMPVEIDEPLLRKISNETGGKYYRATDNQSLDKIYNEINELEKTKVEVSSYKEYKELFFPLGLISITCIAVFLILKYTVFRSFP